MIDGRGNVKEDNGREEGREGEWRTTDQKMKREKGRKLKIRSEVVEK